MQLRGLVHPKGQGVWVLLPRLLSSYGSGLSARSYVAEIVCCSPETSKQGWPCLAGDDSVPASWSLGSSSFKQIARCFCQQEVAGDRDIFSSFDWTCCFN